MKKLIVPMAIVAVITGFSVFVTQGRGQGPAAANKPHKVGLIDMAHVFKEYEKFKVLREDLKAEYAASESKAKQMATQLKNTQSQLKDYKSGSPEYVKLETKLTRMAAEFDAFRKTTQRDFIRKESQIYKTIYLEVADAVEKYATYYNYTLVMRFNRAGLDEKIEATEVIQAMNRQVVYFREDDDITKSVLAYLNNKYKPSSGRNSSGPPRTTSGGSTSGTRRKN